MEQEAASAMKNRRDVGRKEMIAEMKKKGKQGKKGPACEIMDVTDAERERGKYVDKYKEKKELEARMLEPQEQAKKKVEHKVKKSKSPQEKPAWVDVVAPEKIDTMKSEIEFAPDEEYKDE